MRAITTFEGTTVERTGNWSAPEIRPIIIFSPPESLEAAGEIRYTARFEGNQLILNVMVELVWDRNNETDSSTLRRKRQQTQVPMITGYNVAIGTEPIPIFGPIPGDTAVQSFDVSTCRRQPSSSQNLIYSNFDTLAWFPYIYGLYHTLTFSFCRL